MLDRGSLRRLGVVVTALYALLITTLSLVNFSPDMDMPDSPYLDKVVHCCFYLGLNMLLLGVVTLFRGRLTLRDMVFVTLLSMAYSALIEVVQPLTNRTFDPLDLVANGIGAIFGLIIYGLIKDIILRRCE